MAKPDRHIRPGFLLFPLRKYLSKSQNHFLNSYVKPGMTVLDAGSGPGFYALDISRRVGPKGKVIAVDGDMKAIERLRKRTSAFQLTNLEAHATSGADMKMVENESVDVIFSNGMLCCMAEHQKAVHEMLRVMKAGGTAYVSVTKFGKDELSVSEPEFNTLLSDFEILNSGSTRMMRYAIVSKRVQQ